MTDNQIVITTSDFFICKAFSEIISSSNTEIKNKLGEKAPLTIANYFGRLTQEDLHNPAELANRITDFTQQPSNEALNEWLEENYDRLDGDGITKLLKMKADPSEEAEEMPEMNSFLTNEARDIGRQLELWSKEILTENNQETENESN
jgi:hypothetical protein